ncbi:hypothetical protein Ahy_Scaffold1g107330 isoform D [Arachis hypogaea]|uniref:Uncharacterized protein n=1 Tax=Arachis hypogaea TaxID=3818 RepID=A0A444WVJ0_ARAHY|nr:hypothetical protein Ahy_Scaffold1g107330 isoform D [Arachis hypogaea]
MCCVTHFQVFDHDRNSGNTHPTGFCLLLHLDPQKKKSSLSYSSHLCSDDQINGSGLRLRRHIRHLRP